MIAEGYSMDLYCRNEDVDHPFNYFPHNFYGRNRAEVRRDARAMGWVFHKDREVTCPLCNPRRKS